VALLVLAYPTLAPDDHAWIQAMRAEHDARLHGVVAPHITLVFPLPADSTVAPAALVEQARRAAAGQSAIPIALRCAIVAPDAPGGDTLVFLVPDEGFGALVRLHDRLYAGPLAGALRLDLPFIPHITVARAADAWACKRLADEINARPLAIAGSVDALEVIAYDGRVIQTIERVALA
jgi:2'-5' RNA ligase